MNRALVRRPTATAALAEAAGARLPTSVTREQARAVIAAAASTRDRLLFECLWQTGGRVTEVLRLRRGDLDARAGALRLTNLKQRRRALREKLVYVAPELLRDRAAARPSCCATCCTPPRTCAWAQPTTSSPAARRTPRARAARR